MKQIDLINKLIEHAKSCNHIVNHSKNYWEFRTKQDYLIFQYRRFSNDELEINDIIYQEYIRKLNIFRKEDTKKIMPNVKSDLSYPGSEPSKN